MTVELMVVFAFYMQAVRNSAMHVVDGRHYMLCAYAVGNMAAAWLPKPWMWPIAMCGTVLVILLSVRNELREAYFRKDTVMFVSTGVVMPLLMTLIGSLAFFTVMTDPQSYTPVVIGGCAIVVAYTSPGNWLIAQFRKL